MFPDASDIRNLSKETGLTPNEIFKVLQSRFHPAVSEFLAQVVRPQNYHLDQTAFLKNVHRFSLFFLWGFSINFVNATIFYPLLATHWNEPLQPFLILR
jgi:hypothetical protein